MLVTFELQSIGPHLQKGGPNCKPTRAPQDTLNAVLQPIRMLWQNTLKIVLLQLKMTSRGIYIDKVWSEKCVRSNNNALGKLHDRARHKRSKNGFKSGIPLSISILRGNIFYLLTLTFYCFCVMIKATSGLTDNSAKIVVKNIQMYSNYSVNRNSSSSNKHFLNQSLAMNKSGISGQPRKGRDASSLPEEEEYEYVHDDDDELDEYEILIQNKSAMGKYIGAPCELSCDSTLHHVFCDPVSFKCGCEKNYPVVLGLTRGCAKAKKLGEQCFYHQTCIYNDENSLCVQVSHNARCECADGFHSVSYSKPTKRVFCTQDLAVLTSDLPTLLGVSTGIAVLAGLICMVLHLFSKTKYPRHRNFADANIPPPIMYSSDTGIPLTVQSGRPSSRSSLRSSGSIGSYGNRRPSSAPQPGSKGVLVSTSRTGSRRPSLASVHSTSSSVRSYSMMRFEKEIQQKEIRHEMKLRLARLQHHQQFPPNKPQIIVGDAVTHISVNKVVIPTPSPLTPNSTDELLPSVDESQEFSPKMERSDAVYTGPCTSSSEAL